MFKTKNKVRMHDTDMAGILYFARQFRFAHDALEDFVESKGLTFASLFRECSFVFVIRHAEADYLAPLAAGDELTVTLTPTQFGTSSFTLHYDIHRDSDGLLVGTAKTVHVTLDSLTRKKIPIPEEVRALFTTS